MNPKPHRGLGNQTKQQKKMSYTVTLGHCQNPDYPGGYSGFPADPARKVKFPVSSIQQASVACMEYIRRNELGGGNWNSGEVRDAKGKIVARVSYNGRIWEPGEYPQKEIIP